METITGAWVQLRFGSLDRAGDRGRSGRSRGWRARGNLRARARKKQRSWWP